MADTKPAAQMEEQQNPAAIGAAAVQNMAKAKKRHEPLTPQQKAAAVIVSLGADKASQLYQFMDPDDVEQLTLEVARLGFLDRPTRQKTCSTNTTRCA